MFGNNFISESATSIAVTPVNLEADRLNEYTGKYHFDKSLKQLKGTKQSSRSQTLRFGFDIPEFITQLNLHASRINAFLSLCGYVIANGSTLQDIEDSDGMEGAAEYLHRIAASMSMNLKPEAVAKLVQTNDFKTDLRGAMAATMASGKMVIKDSTIYEGGRDIYFNNVIGSSGLTGEQASDYIPVVRTRNYEERRLADYSTPTSLRLIELLKKFREEALCGSVADAHMRTMRHLPFDYNFEKWRARFQAAGLVLDDEMMSRFLQNFPMSPARMKDARDFLSIAVTSEPHSELFKHGAPWQLYASDPSANPEPNNEETASPEGILTKNDLAYSVCLHIPADFVNYITQTEDHDAQLFKLTNWAKSWSKFYIRPKNAKAKTKKDDGKSKDESESNAGAPPKYVLSASMLPKLAEERKKVGLPVNDSLGDQYGLTINRDGNLAYIPAREDFDVNKAAEYEKVNEDLARLCYDAGIPMLDSAGGRAVKLTAQDLNFDEKFEGLNHKLTSFYGTLLGYDLDFGILCYAGQSQGVINTIELGGTTKPEDIAIADMLGFDFAGEGESPNFKSFRKAMLRLIPRRTPNVAPEEFVADYGKPAKYVENLIKPVLATYLYQLQEPDSKLKPLQKIIHECMEDLEIEDLRTDPLNRDIYLSPSKLNDKGTLMVGDLAHSFIPTVMSLLSTALINAKCEAPSPLLNILAQEFGSASAAMAEAETDHRYFNEEKSKLGDFSNLYNHLGGRIILKICEAIVDIDPKKLLAPIYNPELAQLGIKYPNYEQMSRTVLPSAILYSKYVPHVDEIFEKAEDYIDSLKPESSFEPDDLKLPGLIEGTAAFPHQLSALSTLQHKPKFAILDISPGGGKTILMLLDILNLIGRGEKIKPIVFAPDHLVTNWCDDLFKVTKGTWNAIPLSAKASNIFSDEEIDEVLGNAPVNTIVVAGMTWLKNTYRQTSIAIGTKTVSLPERVDLLRKHEFNYVGVDESHKAKKYDPYSKGISAVHTALKLVCTAPYVDYIRLATGTLTPDRVKDVVGQANLFTASIFGTIEMMEFDLEVNEEVDGREVERDDAPLLIRSKLGDYVALITKKRKDWAFMLPNPIDNFISCNFGIEDSDLTAESVADRTSQDVGDLVHYQVYTAILNETEDDLKNKGDSEDPDVDDADSVVGNASDELEVGEDGEAIIGGITEQAITLYTQRLEQMLTDPWGEELFVEQAAQYGVTRKNFTPVKLRTLTQRLELHFNSIKYDPSKVGATHQGLIQWERGMEHRELDLVTYEGQTYMARNLDVGEGEEGGGSLRKRYPTPSDIPPPEDLARWKPERTGKVLIFCRYVRTANAVYNALPAKFKRVARLFHGSVKEQAGEDKWANLELFRDQKSNDCQILVAVEQAITEGQNLQIASRIIRVEAPWSPGDYEQATARIFRPDVAAATLTEDGKAGDMAREVIFIDWLMCNGTLEVAKVARLAAKSVETTMFSEKGNPRYDALRDLVDSEGKPLKPPSMSIALLREFNTMDQMMPYFEAKATLNDIEKREFWEMRKTTVAAMVPIPSGDVLPDFETLEVKPVAPNVHLEDGKHKWERYIDVAKSNREAIKADAKGFFTNQPVNTPFGKGVIVGMYRKMIDDPEWLNDPKIRQQLAEMKAAYRAQVARAEADGLPKPKKPDYPTAPKIPDPENPISTFRVRLADKSKANGRFKAGEMTQGIPANLIHFAKGLSQAEFDAEFKSSKVWATDTDRKKVEREEEAIRTAEEERIAEEKKREARERARIAREKRRQEAIEARIANEASGRPINEGVSMTSETKPKPNAKTDMRVAMQASVYNGFIAIMAQLKDPDARAFDDMFGFVEFDKFIYIDLFTYDDFEAVADWLETRETKKGGGFILDKATTLKNLDLIVDVFDSANKEKFSRTLARNPQAELPFFLRARIQKPRGKNPESRIRIYPVVLEDRVRLCIDTQTSPQVAAKFLKYAPIKGYKGRSGKEVKGKWTLNSEGHTVFFCSNITEAKRKVKQILTAGYKITNGKTLVKNLDKIKTVRAKNHKL